MSQQHGRISSRWPTEEFNKVVDDLINLLGGNILMEKRSIKLAKRFRFN